MYNNNFRRPFRPQNNNRRFMTTSPSVVRAILAMQIKSTIEPLETTIEEAYVSTHKFSDFLISEDLKANILKKYVTPMPIQDQAIPAVLEGKDVIGIANTGTGKTAAFLIPLIDKVLKNKSERVIIVCPTRELAVQINDEFVFFARGLGINSATLIGGVSLYGQQMALRRFPNFVIGTPGRIKDMIESRALNLSGFRNIVLDETDRMVDIGFLPDIKYLISLLPQVRQSLFFSATVSFKVKEILNNFVKNPVTISVRNNEAKKNVMQKIVKVENNTQKFGQLFDLLKQEQFDKVLIFGRTKFSVQKLTDELNRLGFKAGALHGNKSQSNRQMILNQFKNNRINILLATDIASRGLDIDSVSHVINYDVPQTVEDYIHRIGRTARADKTGTAITFIERFLT
jgi:ATP-dependent RNA helicase RhlE